MKTTTENWCLTRTHPNNGIVETLLTTETIPPNRTDYQRLLDDLNSSGEYFYEELTTGQEHNIRAMEMWLRLK
jgi:hypothetical protein